MKLYLLRHGETDANVQGIVQGWLDTKLNEKGLNQARDAARMFNKTIQAIYSSDLTRARSTAEEFRLRHVDVPYFEDARLRERNFGDAAGTHRDRYDWEQFWSLDNRVTIPNAETLNDFTARVVSFLEDLKKQPYDTVLIVTHGGVLNRIQAILDPRHRHYSHANATMLELKL